MQFLKIAGRKSPILTLFVASLPGQGGVDYGYTKDPKLAAPLSAKMIREFRAYIESFSQDVVFESVKLASDC